jgi:hypothetical protein
MNNHFCNCPSDKCDKHGKNQDNGCDPCIQKNLELGEIPACFWLNVEKGIKGATDYSVGNFVKFYLEKQK